jgi:hypothetical protein
MSLKGPFNDAYFDGYKVIPAGKDVSLRQHIIYEKYRCISHLWGKKPPIWYDHPVQGSDWPVEMREEKRDKLKQILYQIGGYWWVDVFCTNQADDNRPLEIMGDIYKNCGECICMIDYTDECTTLENCIINGDVSVTNKYMDELDKSIWFTRIWTFQEYMLPERVCHTSEKYTGTAYFISPTQLRDAYDRGIKFDNNTRYRGNLTAYFLKEIKDITSININSVVDSIMDGKKQCENKEDYYYGIAGMFGIWLTPGQSYEIVEKEFMEKCNTRGIHAIPYTENFIPIWVDGMWVTNPEYKYKNLYGRMLISRDCYTVLRN